MEHTRQAGKLMKILVCIKQVVDSGSEIHINDSKNWVEISGSTRFGINKFDTYAVEEALLIKKQHPGSMIDVVCVGPDHAEDALRRALGMGADEGIHILDNLIGYKPPFLTGSRIAAYAVDRCYDLILTGIMSEDEMNGQTGPIIAELLSIPCCTSVINTKISPKEGKIKVEKETEGGIKKIFDIELPCVLALQTGINIPRYPSLSKVLRAKKKKLKKIHAKAPENQEQTLTMTKIQFSRKKRKGIFLKGNIDDKADKLIEILEARAMLR